MENVWLHRYAVLLAVCTLFLVVAGALVTSNDAGLSVPDWPLSYGKVMPPMEGGILFEHGHRMVAATVGFLTMILAIWVSVVEKRRWMRWLGYGALAAVAAQGVLGGLTVMFMLPKEVSIGHACLAELFFSTTVAIALFTSPSWKAGPHFVEDSGWPPLRALAILLPVLTLGQVALGASYRHRALGIVPHVVGAMVVTGYAMLVAVFVLTQFRGHRSLQRAAKSLMVLVLSQVFLGIAAYMSRISNIDSAQRSPALVVFTVLHVAVGASTLAACVVLAIQILRNVRRPEGLPSRAACQTG